MFDTLLLRPSIYCNTPLHFTTLHPTTLHYKNLQDKQPIVHPQSWNLCSADSKAMNIIFPKRCLDSSFDISQYVECAKWRVRRPNKIVNFRDNCKYINFITAQCAAFKTNMQSINKHTLKQKIRNFVRIFLFCIPFARNLLHLARHII